MRPDQLPSLLDHCLAGLYVLSGDRILWANARAAEMVGCKPEELVGGSFLPFIYPPDLPIVKARAKAGAPYVIRAVRRDGQLVYLEAHQRAVQIDGKPLIVEFYTTWCGPCKLFDARVLPDHERSVGIDCALQLAIDEQPIEEFDRAFDRNSSGEKSARLRWHERAIGWPLDEG